MIGIRNEEMISRVLLINSILDAREKDNELYLDLDKLRKRVKTISGLIFDEEFIKKISEKIGE